MTRTDNLNVKIFADGADLDGIRKLAQNPLIKGFTTNPTLIACEAVRPKASTGLSVRIISSGMRESGYRIMNNPKTSP